MAKNSEKGSSSYSLVGSWSLLRGLIRTHGRAGGNDDVGGGYLVRHLQQPPAIDDEQGASAGAVREPRAAVGGLRPDYADSCTLHAGLGDTLRRYPRRPHATLKAALIEWIKSGT